MKRHPAIPVAALEPTGVLLRTSGRSLWARLNERQHFEEAGAAAYCG
jgi:hypothetical protein